MSEKVNKEFIKVLVKSVEKKAEESNMDSKTKNEYMIQRLYEYFDRNGFNKISDVVEDFEEICPEFSKDDFVKYVVTHTSNTDIIFDEKLKIEEKIKEITNRIYSNNRELGYGMVIHDSEKSKYVFGKIQQIKDKYSLKTNMNVELSDEQIEDNIILIEQMIDEFDDMKELHEMAISQKNFFDGMGEKYEEVLREKSPEYAKFIDESMKKEIRPYEYMKQRIKEETKELEQLKQGFQDCIDKIYDPRLEPNRRGNKKEREKLKFEAKAR